jgi:hypothetical protein
MTSRRARAALAAAAGLALAASGCAGNVEPFSALAVDPRLLAGDIPDALGISRTVEVRHVTHLIFWVPSDGQPPTLEKAVTKALERGRGDVLVNATIERVAWYVPILYGEYGWVVRGDVVRLRSRHADRFDTPLEPDAAESEITAPEPHERPASKAPGS